MTLGGTRARVPAINGFNTTVLPRATLHLVGNVRALSFVSHGTVDMPDMPDGTAACPHRMYDNPIGCSWWGVTVDNFGTFDLPRHDVGLTGAATVHNHPNAAFAAGGVGCD
eukprot:gene6627-48421_t